MRPLLAALLCTTLACSGSEPAKPVAPAASPEAPTTGVEADGARAVKAGGKKKKPKNSNPAPVSVGVPVNGQQPIAVVAVDGQAVVMSEGRGATLRMDPARAYWTGTNLALTHNEGLLVFGAGESTWWQPGALPPGAAPLAQVLTDGGQLGSWVEVETLASGQYRVWLNISGKRSRLGIFKSKPTASLYLLAPAPTARGQESIRLSKASGFTFDASGKPQPTLPTEATALPVEAPAAELKTAWTADLSKLRGAAARITWSTLVDLDRDDVKEGFVCATGGKDDQDCYVVETVDGVHQYNGVSSMRYTGSGQAPQAFTLRGGTYVMHVSGGERSVLWVARFDGADFLVESVN